MDPKEIDAQIASLKAEIANLQAMKSKMSSPSEEGEMTMKEMLTKLGDPRADMVSDDPVSKASAEKKVPTAKQAEDKKELGESLDRAMAKAGVENPAPDLPPEPDPAAPDFKAMLDSIREDAENLPDGPKPEDPDTAVGGEAQEVDDPVAMSLFRDVHGGDFDPKSKMDKQKLQQIKQLLVKEDFGDLSDRGNRNKFALKIYRM
tara:strand:+ start:72 stop:683 length:612 start_codon:yes stop_codon:yes gene_type:complete